MPKILVVHGILTYKTFPVPLRLKLSRAVTQNLREQADTRSIANFAKGQKRHNQHLCRGYGKPGLFDAAACNTALTQGLSGPPNSATLEKVDDHWLFGRDVPSVAKLIDANPRSGARSEATKKIPEEADHWISFSDGCTPWFTTTAEPDWRIIELCCGWY